MKKDQVLRVTATTTVDFVFFKVQNVRERFDQARTKVYNMKLFITAGGKLMEETNQHMMTIRRRPFNLNQHMKIDGITGRMEHTQVRPKEGNYMDIRAEMDLLVALSACPDLPVGGKPVDVLIYEP